MNHGRLLHRRLMLHIREDLLNHEVFAGAQWQAHLRNVLICS